MGIARTAIARAKASRLKAREVRRIERRDERAAAALAAEPLPATLREFLESPEWCGLTLSPMVAAIVDASQGIRPTTIDDATCLRYFGCALDGVDAHKKFIQHHELPFPLLADTQGVVAERFGVLGGIGPVKMARRVTFVVNAEGQITHIFDPARTKGHAQEVLDALNEGASA